MKFKIALCAAALALAPALAFASGCSHEKQAMSCAEGSVYDADTGTCKEVSA